ncbi:MAG: radical SAM protein [Spirochaetales bacterium]|nr:radical SAM protein [Spirochaetales bacterium]
MAGLIKGPNEGSIIVTYRCPMNCVMCNIHGNPTEKQKEIAPEICERLPRVSFLNITGGEPFIREDLEEFVARLRKKARRIVISTSGWYVERVLELASKYPDIGIRVSLEGLCCTNDSLRGRKGGFDRGLTVLLELRRMGIKDIGFGITLSDSNVQDLLKLYELAKNLRMEFATAAVHNSYYFHVSDNSFQHPEKAESVLKELVERLLKENNVKSWFRAFFNYGLINFIRKGPRVLPCEAGMLNFFLDPYGNVFPCNGMEECFWFERMGNLAETKSFKDIWESGQAERVRNKVRNCPKQCWMIGTAAPVMKKYIHFPLAWVVRNKLRLWTGRGINYEVIRPFTAKGKQK